MENKYIPRMGCEMTDKAKQYLFGKTPIPYHGLYVARAGWIRAVEQATITCITAPIGSTKNLWTEGRSGNKMTFEEWWNSEERDNDWYLPIIAKAAWFNATKIERERCAKICEAFGESEEGSSEGYEGVCAAKIRV